VRTTQTKTITVEAGDRDEVLVQWLNELLFYFDSEQFLCKEFTVLMMSETWLKAWVRGEKADKSRHALKRAIKSATYHMLKIERLPAGYQIRVLLDI